MSSSDPPNAPTTPLPPGAERRSAPRYEVTWSVDCDDGETFLYASITNISALGIFIATRSPPPAGTAVTLRFTPPGEREFDLRGEVAWVNPVREDRENINPGFGVRFIALDPDMRERLVSLVHAIAYLPS
ncbi:MAG: TIGR02266 family protein [Polyangiales bacterium]|jgi:type IV pilus assembly protein PilZ